MRRFALRSIRYRQSIGDQMLNTGALENSELADVSDPILETGLELSLCDYGNDEADKFLHIIHHSSVSDKSLDNERNSFKCEFPSRQTT